jgi:hypothetical protein
MNTIFLATVIGWFLVIVRAYPKNRWHSPIQVDNGLYLNTRLSAQDLKLPDSEYFMKK